MAATEMTKEIADLNLTYMLLAQKLLREDKAAAMLRLGISNEMADLLIRSQRVAPRRLLEEGFDFRYKTLDAALADLTRARS